MNDLSFLKPNNKKSVLNKLFFNSIIAYLLSDIPTVIGPMVDAGVVANYLNVDAVAAVGLFSPFVMFYSIIGGILAGGSRGMYTTLVGKGEIKKANFVFTISCCFSIIISAILIAICLIFSDQLAILLGASGANEHLKPYLVNYIRGIIPGVAFLSLSKVLNVYMHLDRDSGRAIYSLALMTAVNIFLDFYVVNYTNSGIFGIGLATTIGNFVWCFVLMCHFLRRERLLHFNFSEIRELKKYFVEMFVNGSNAAVTRVCKMAAGLLINYLLTIYATSIYIAAFSAQKAVISLVGGIYLGVADTVLVMSGIYYGEENRNALDELQQISIRLGVYISIIAGVILFICAKYLAIVYVGTKNIEAYNLGIESIRMVALSLPIFVINFSFSNYLTGVKLHKRANLYSFMMQLGFVVPTAYFLIRLLGGRGAWIATPVAAVFTAFFGLYFIEKYDKKLEFDDKRLMVDKFFGKHEDREIEITADSMLEVVGMSRIAKLFCKENDVDERQANILALCIEEMGGNIIEYGFSDNKPHSLNMRIVVKNEEIIVRIRDDCKPFNPVERYNMTKENSDDPTKNIGIRMVMKLCSSVNYISTFNTNSLIIKIPVKVNN